MNPTSSLFRPLCLAWLISAPLFAANGDFQPATSLPAVSSPRGVGVGDVFGNGVNSFIVANFGSPTFIGQTTPATLLNPQNSSLQVYSPSPSGLKLVQTIPTASSPRGVCLFDLDSKGWQDILVTAYDANLLQVFSWKKGQFAKTSEQPTLTMPVGVAAGLTSPHGVPFAAAADFGSNTLSLFEIKEGKLGKRYDIPVPAGPTQVAIGDLNGDGINEIAVVCLPAHQIVIFSKNTGTKEGNLPSYSASQTITLPDGSAPCDLRIADFNGDGKADLAVEDFSKNLVLVYLQQKDGSLAAQPPLPTSGSHPNGLTVADLKGDGTKEIIVANRDSDTIDLFQWVGSAFQLAKTLKVANDANSSFGPVEVAALDTTGQGKLDLVASHMRSNTIKVLAQVAPTPSSSNVTASFFSPLEQGTPFSEKTTTCFPNPSHDGKVKFSFTLPSPSSVNLQIFDVGGETVWNELLNPSQTQAGVNTVSWDGVNQGGQNLASGMYLCRISVGDASVTKKVVILH